jgi:hypothetical protein
MIKRGIIMIIKTSNFVVFVYLFFSAFTFWFWTNECLADAYGPDEWSYIAADFNGDGSPDVLVVSGMGKGNRIWFNNGIGEFYPSEQILDYSVVGALAVDDIDNDGDVDIFVANIDSPNKIWLNDGRGYFILGGQAFDIHRSICVSLGDIDSDGNKDAAVAYADGTLEIFSNNGAGFFYPIQTLKSEKGITSIEFKDVNGDKATDIVCFRNSNAISAFVNSGNSRFNAYDGNIEITASLSEAAQDLTGDGKPDGVFINNEGVPSPANYYGGHPMLGATGGPDSYGYVWEDTSYAWIVQAFGSTWTALTEDSVSGAIPLGFTFNFYGTDYTSIYIASDGYVQFSDPYASDWQFWPNYASSSADPNSAAYGFGTDLDPTAGGTIYYQTHGTAPNRYFVVSYNNVPTWGDNNLDVFQIILYETTNRIKYNYYYVTPDYSYASIGIENPGGTARLLRCHLWCSPADYSSLIFYLAPEIELYRGGTDMPVGSSYNFGRVAIGSTSSVTFTIYNSGRVNLNLSSTFLTGTNALQFSIIAWPSSPVGPLGGTQNVTVRFNPTAEGVMVAALQINNDDPSENPYIINLYGGGDDNAPTVDITSPIDGSIVTGTVNIDANATDDRGINRVEFYRDNTLIGSDMTAPYSIPHNFATDPPGVYLIKVIAFDTLNQTAMDAIKVVVGGDAPVVDITNPVNGANVTGIVTIEATATDITGIDRVEFTVNGALQCTDNTAPYQCVWDTRLLPLGSYIIRAVAYDTTAQSAVDMVTVRTADSPPDVKITEPASSANIFGSTIIKADAWDNSRVVSVDFYVNGSLLCSDTEAPYECEWDALNVSVGIYTIKAVATDNLGQTGKDQIMVQRRVQVNLSVMRRTEKAWIVKKDYAEILVTLPDYGAAAIGRLRLLRNSGSGNFETIKDIFISELQNNSYQFMDRYLESGKTYQYKIIVEDSNMIPIGESDLITI